MGLGDFLEAVERDDACVRPLYLAQLPLIERRGDRGALLPAPGLPPSLAKAALALVERLPSGVSSSVSSCNLWCNASASTSAMHCDEPHGLLVVLRGRKRVRLVAPHRGSELRAHPVWRETPNHSRLPGDELSRFVADFEVDLGRGEALLIPEGWWHEVQVGGRLEGIESSHAPCTTSMY